MQATTREDVLQNLKDAGCNPGIIARFMTCQDAGKTKDSLRVLAPIGRRCWTRYTPVRPSWTAWTI